MKSNVDGSSHQRCSVKKGVLKIFANFTGKPLCFPGKFVKFLGTPILKNICERLLLQRACGWRGWGQGQMDRLNNKTQIAKAITDWDL